MGSTLAFTGGIGERSAPIRQEAGQGLEFLGVVVDESADAQPAEDREFGPAGTLPRAGDRRP